MSDNRGCDAMTVPVFRIRLQVETLSAFVRTCNHVVAVYRALDRVKGSKDARRLVDGMTDKELYGLLLDARALAEAMRPLTFASNPIAVEAEVVGGDERP